MKHEQALALINEVERNIPVAQWRIHGVQLWPIVRCRLIFAAFDESVGGGWARGGHLRRVGRRAASALRSAGSAIRDLPRGHLLRSFSDAIVVTDGVAVTRIDGKAYDIVGDPLARLIRDAGATVNTWYTTYACPPDRETEGVLVQWRLDAAQLGIARRGRGLVPGMPGGYQDFLDFVQGAGLPPQAVGFGRMARLAARVAVMAECFEGWLRAATPKLVFVNCYYTLEGLALMMACARRGIVSVDVQHGVQGDQHVAYGSWVNVPSAGYEMLPERFWCWSEREARAINSWSVQQINRHGALVGGNPWMEMWQEAKAPFVAAADRAVRALLRPDTRTVLVTLQWGMTDEVFLDPLIDLIAAAGDTWTWWVRLHPIMSARREDVRARLHAHGNGRVLLDEPSDLALPALLRHSDVHLTHSSSTVLEAAALGVPSVVTSSSGAAYYPDLVGDGTAVVCDGMQPEGVMSALRMMASRRRPTAAGTPGQGPSAVRQLLAEARSRDAMAAGMPT